MTRILIIPSVRQGNGTGHLERAIVLADSDPERFALFLDREGTFAGEKPFDLSAYAPACEIDLETLLTEEWRYILLDRRETSAALFRRLTALAPLAGLDEGGPLRGSFDYLIDTLPRLDRAVPNLYAPFWNPAPTRRRSEFGGEEEIGSVLVSFGGQDPAGLTAPTVRTLIDACGLKPETITAVRGPAAAFQELPAGVMLLDAPRDLRERLAGYDALVCSFGLTAFEALRARIPVITVNPTRYHDRLAAAAALPRAGVGVPSPSRLERLLAHPGELRDSCRTAAEAAAGGDGCGPVPAKLNPGSRECPGCGSAEQRLLSRMPERSFYRCRRCGLVFQQPWIEDTTSYDEAYFFDEYRRQYGVSYLEDFPHIQELARRRLKHIRPAGEGASLLDVGCAYGPFLAAAAEAGYRVEGVEPARAAAEYVERNFGYPVHNCGLAEFAARNRGRQWDVVTLWYVIEHFPDLMGTLEILAGLVRPGGMLAVGTPNGRGVSALTSPGRFYRSSPGDHYTILDPRSARRLLKTNGFRVEGFRATGIHRERFPRLIRSLWPAARHVASAALFGDTFEIYARRVADAAGEGKHG